jgi:hypothetical protein
MQKFARSLFLLCLPVLLASCSMNKADSLSQQDLETVIFFCDDYSNFSKENTTSVLDIESDYLSNVAILIAKYPNSLELKQLDLTVQSAFEYADWVRADGSLKFVRHPNLLVIHEKNRIEDIFHTLPPTPAQVITDSLTQSCEPFKD